MAVIIRDTRRKEINMRLIHTSDWHFGKRLLKTDLLPLQATFCDWLVELVRDEKIECVMISGDIYDRADPKDDAVDLLDDVLNRIRGAGASIVAISGNHDSADRLHFGTRFMSSSGLHIRTERREIKDIAAPLTIEGRDGTEVEILPIPYLDPMRVAMAEHSVPNHESVLKAVIQNQISQLKNPSRAIAMAHAFVVGGRESESERKLTVGGTGSVSSDLFKDFGYVALGHLHIPHELGDGRLVYSGTPMPYSFSEEPKKDEDKKSVRVINVDSDSLSSVVVPCTNFRDVITLEGSLEDIMSAAKYSKYEDFFVRVRLTDAGRQIGVMDRLRRRFPHLLEVIPRQSDQQKLLDSVRLKEMARRSHEEVVREYISETFPQGLNDFQKSFINEALADMPNGDAS